MGRPVDQDDLDRAALAAAPDDPAAGPDDRLGHDQPPRWVERARQAVGRRPAAAGGRVAAGPVAATSASVGSPMSLLLLR
jgi:hypothetical protein